MEEKASGRAALVCLVVVFALATAGLVIGLAIVASQLNQYSEAASKRGYLGKCELEPDICAHLCTNTKEGHQCSCREGYVLAADGTACQDVNECISDSHGCYQECVNSEGSFSCSCRTSYKLHEDGKQCLALPLPSQLSLGSYVKTAISSGQETCNNIATVIFDRGGNVVDAAIAAEACEGVLSANFIGIGGGFMMTIYAAPRNESKKKVETLIARETAPMKATEDMYVDNRTSSFSGGLSIGIPGEVAGLYAAWERYGSLPWPDLLAPAIKLARDGFKMNYVLANAVNFSKDHGMPDFRELSQLFLPGGKPISVGEMIRMPKLAATLQKIADEGASAFYNGSLTDDIVADIADAGGIITRQDLENYKPVWKTPLRTTLKNGQYSVYGPPPPSSAAVIQFMMSILDEYNFTSTTADDPLTYHRIIEAMKFGFAKRSELGDEDFFNVTEILEELASKERANYIKGKINDDTTMNDIDYYEHRFMMQPDAGTAHFSLIGPDGSAVSMTSTVNYFFGSLVLGSRTGIIFNNQMDDFSTPGQVNAWNISPSPSNFIAPGKRPMSSTSPLIVLGADDSVRLVVGGAGGARIISNVLTVRPTCPHGLSGETMINNLWLGFPLDQAVNRPRIHHQLLPNDVDVEPNMPQAIIDFLKSRNHTLNVMDNHFYFGGVMAAARMCSECPDAVSCDVSCIKAAGDWRTQEGGSNMSPKTGGF